MAKRDQEEEELSPEAQAEEGAVMEKHRASAGTQAGKEERARGKLSVALLSESGSGAIKKERKKSSPGKRREAPEVVEKPPAREMGAPEFAELSSFSLLNAHEFAESEDVNAFLEAELTPGTTLESLPDNEYRELLKKEEAFAVFVAKRLVRESMDQILSRPVVPDSILERALEMHPETQAYAKAVEEARKAGEKLARSLEVLADSRRKIMDISSSLVDVGHGEMIDDFLVVRFDQKETDIELQLKENTALQEQLTEQAKEGKVSLDAKYREEMAALSRRIAGVMEKVAETCPGAIQRDANGQFRLDIEKLSADAKERLGLFLAVEASEVEQAGYTDRKRQKELNLRLLLETDWMLNFALEDIQESRAGRSTYTPSSDSRLLEEPVLLVWSTAVDVLKTGDLGLREDPDTLKQFLNAEAHIFQQVGVESHGVHVPDFDREMPSVLPSVIERARHDADMVKEIFASKQLVQHRLRAMYPNRVWDEAREPIVTQVQDIVKHFGPKFKDDPDFHEFMGYAIDGVFHQASYDQIGRVSESLIPFLRPDEATMLRGRLLGLVGGWHSGEDIAKLRGALDLLA